MDIVYGVIGSLSDNVFAKQNFGSHKKSMKVWMMIRNGLLP